MKKFKSYNEFLNEDGAFAAVGAAPAGNVSGAGNISTPGGNVGGVYGDSGSGDAWPSLFKPFSLVPLKKRKRRRKKKNKR